MFRVGAVNCEESQSLCNHYKVQGYPTILSLVPESSDPVPYNGQRSSQAFYDHSQRLVSSKYVSVAQSEDQAKTLCEQNSSKPCLVVLSDKSTPVPLLKALAYRIRDHVFTVLVKVAPNRRNPVFGSKDTPIPSLFVNGNTYKGVNRMDDIYKFVVAEVKKQRKASSSRTRDDL